MAKIEKIELRMVDLVPKVKRTDAIQSFISQKTPIVTITDSDGATGTFSWNCMSALAPEKPGIGIDWDWDEVRRQSINAFNTVIAKGAN